MAVLPIGYGDGVRRGLTNDADVLIGGRRYPLVGTVSMDNVTVDVGPDPAVAPGDRAILIGSDGDERDPRRGVGAAARHDQLRDHLRPDAAGAARASPGLGASDRWKRRARERWRSRPRAARSPGAPRVGGRRGALRDRLLGRETDDVDLVVDGDPRAAARALARADRAARRSR